METFLGVKYYPTNPDPKDIRLIDIAHALSMQCRYAGHVTKFYSVAEHSVRVSEIVKPENAMYGLMHDASEAYLQDMIRPLKIASAMGDEYRKLEHLNMAAVCVRFGLTFPFPHDIEEDVKRADNILLFTEKRDLRLTQVPWKDEHKFTPLPETIKPWPPGFAEHRFLRRYGQIRQERLSGVGENYMYSCQSHPDSNVRLREVSGQNEKTATL